MDRLLAVRRLDKEQAQALASRPVSINSRAFFSTRIVPLVINSTLMPSALICLIHSSVRE